MRRRGSGGGHRGVVGLVSLLVVAVILAAGCQAGSTEASSKPKGSEDSSPTASSAKTAKPDRSPTRDPEPRATISVKPGQGSKDVRPDTPIVINADNGRLSKVSVTTKDGSDVGGDFNADRTRWRADGALKPDTTYQVAASALDAAGLFSAISQTFQTVDADTIFDTDVYPLEGQTVGVGMPIVVELNAPVSDDRRAAFQKRLSVETSKDVQGTWHWFNDEELHWRPREYWPAYTDVTLTIDSRGFTNGDGAWGDKRKVRNFEIGRSVVTHTNLDTHEMKVYVDGSYARTIPISAGKPGWETRSGTKVVLQRRQDVRMRSSTIGVPDKDDPNYYDVTAEYALRVTWSGEFLHSAPWSVGAQGEANTSHGCVGMSTENAKWLWNISDVGDPAETVGSNDWMGAFGNGFGDWNLSWAEWKAGSALTH